MLSRIAESMFWIGRYVERAEDTAPILDVQTQLLLEDTSGSEETTCRNLLAIMGVEVDPDARVDTRLVLVQLAYDSHTTHRSVVSGQFRAAGPASGFRWVRDRAALINGAADATMTRDEGWQFLILGRCLERAEAATRRSCAPTRAPRPSAWPPSSCCWTGSSRGP